MSEINNLSVEKIIEQMGLAVKTNEYGIVFRGNDEAMQKLRRILRRFERDADFTRDDTQDAIVELLKEYDATVDKEKLVMLTAYNLKRSLEIIGKTLDAANKKSMKKDLSNATAFLSKLNTRIVFPEYIPETGLVGRINVIDSKELEQVIKQNKPLKTLFSISNRQRTQYKEKIEKIGGLEGVISLIDFDDIESIIAVDKEIGLQISGQITNNIYQKFQGDNPKRKILEEAEENPEQIEREIVKGGYRNREIIAGLEANCNFVNVDNLFLLIGYRIIQDLEADRVEVHYKGDESSLEKQREYGMQGLEVIVKSLYKQITEGAVIQGINSEDREEFTYSKEELRQDCVRFQNGRYYKKAEVKSILEDIKTGKMLCEDVPSDLQNLVEFDDDIWMSIMINHIQNLIFLIKRRDGNAEIIYYYINAMEKIPEEVLIELAQKETIDVDKIMEFFEQGKINAGQIKSTGLSAHISQDMINNRIKGLYCRIQDPENEADKAKNLSLFNKYSVLYRILNIEGKTEEEIEENGFALVSTFEDELSNSALQELYQHGLITLNVAADWGVNLTEMLETNQMKPTDLRRLYSEGTIRIEQIRDIIRFGAISNDEKQDLIYATFDGDTQEEETIRNELIQLLVIGEEYKGEERKSGRRRTGEAVSKGKNFVTDPQTRWKLISLLDKEYSKKILPEGKQVLDGHRVFLLPSQDKIIIEKMYEKRRGEMVSAYGSATYIMDAEDFYDNIDDIVKSSAINRSFLYEMADQERATSIMHSKNWGKNVMKYFGIDEQNERYTQDEYLEILNAAERVTSSRKERE